MRNHPRVLLISVGVAILAVWSVTYVMRDSRYHGVPKRAIAAIEAGDLALAKDSIEQALRHYFVALDLDPALSELHGRIAEAYFLAGLKHNQNRKEEMREAMFSQSRQYIHQALAIRPSEPHALFVQGLLYAFNGRIDSAISYMRSAESQGLHRYSLHTNLGFLYNEQGELGRALEEYQKAYEIRKDDPSTIFNLGELYFHLGNYGKAVELYSAMLRLDPKDNRAKANYAAAMWKNGDERKAKEILNGIIKETEGRQFIGYNIVSWVLIDKALDPIWGLNLAHAADALKPNNLESTDILGWGYYVTGDYENAVKYLNRSMIKKPSEEVRRRLQMAKDKLEESRKK